MNELDMLCTIEKAYSSAIAKVTDPIKQGTLYMKNSFLCCQIQLPFI